MSNFWEWLKVYVYSNYQYYFINRKEINTMTKFNFTDRETYKRYASEWKAEYKANSATIRRMKAEIKAAQISGNHDEASRLQSSREYLRSIQRRALEERAETKVEAQRQYLAARDAEKIAA